MIRFINVADSGAVSFPVVSVVAVGFAILIVPLLDTLRVFAIRIYNGRSPFTPDRNHVHHLLLDRGLNHATVTFICVGINIGFVALAYFLKNLGPNYVLFLMLAISFTGFGFLYYRKPRTTMVIAKKLNGATEFKTASKVVTLNQETAAVEEK